MSNFVIHKNMQVCLFCTSWSMYHGQYSYSKYLHVHLCCTNSITNLSMIMGTALFDHMLKLHLNTPNFNSLALINCLSNSCCLAHCLSLELKDVPSDHELLDNLYTCKHICICPRCKKCAAPHYLAWPGMRAR